MYKVAILITTKRECGQLSLDCLEEYHRQTDPLEADEKCSFSIFVNDKGPDGWQKVWEDASSEGFDFYIWMDYGLRLKKDAFSVFMENSGFLRHKAVIAGTVADPDGNILYGGRTKYGRLIEPDATIPVPCHLYDMNLVMIPEYAFSRMENPSSLFRLGFFDYGFGDSMAKEGVARVIAPGILAEMDRETGLPVWKNPDYTPYERLKAFLKAAGMIVTKTIHSLFK